VCRVFIINFWKGPVAKKFKKKKTQGGASLVGEDWCGGLIGT